MTSIQETKLMQIADAIRLKENSSDEIIADSFPERIKNLPVNKLPLEDPSYLTRTYLVRIIEYDGTIIREEIVKHGEKLDPPQPEILPNLPAIPDIQPELAFMGYNQDINAVITGPIEAGVLREPVDKCIHLFVDIPKGVSSWKIAWSLLNHEGVIGGVNIDWGDNTTTFVNYQGIIPNDLPQYSKHEYSVPGKYEIIINYKDDLNPNIIFVVGSGASFISGSICQGIFLTSNIRIPFMAFYNNYSLKRLSFSLEPNGGIDDRSLFNGTGLQVLVLPFTIQNLSNNFSAANSLQKLSMPFLNGSGTFNIDLLAACKRLIFRANNLSQAETTCIKGNNVSYIYLENLREIKFSIFRDRTDNIKEFVFKGNKITSEIVTILAKLDALILTSPTIVTVDSNSYFAFQYYLKIYVPANLIEQYKKATNWVPYAHMIFPIPE